MSRLATTQEPASRSSPIRSTTPSFCRTWLCPNGKPAGAQHKRSVTVVPATARVDVEPRHRRRVHDERPHHALVLVVEDVAVVHELPGGPGEQPGHGVPLPGLHLEDVLPALLVLLQR